jgi:hypothetical protein
MSDRDIPSNLRSFQLRVWDWCRACFQRPDALSPEQRAFRFIEEAIELVQAIGTSREDVQRLVEYVYGRPAGCDTQEVGGVMVTLAALSQSRYLDMQAWGEEELRRCIANMDRIRAKDLVKPERSPLPGNLQVETGPEPSPDMAHLDAVQLRRIIDRHIRWRATALRLLEQVNTGYEGEWPEIAEFVRNSTTAPLVQSPPKAAACNHDLQDPAKTLKATLAPHFGWRCTVCGDEWFPEKTSPEPCCNQVAGNGDHEAHCPNYPRES